MTLQELGTPNRANHNGGIFVNTIGMGKTISMLILILIRYLYLVYYLEMLKDKEEGSTNCYNIAESDNLTVKDR